MASGDTLALLHPFGNEPPATLFANLGWRNLHPVLRFDTTTQWAAIWSFLVPRCYAGGNVTVYVHHAAATATTGTIGWDVTFERLTAGGQDTDADGFASVQTITAATVNGTSGILSVTNVVITAGATGTDSFAAGDLVRVRVRRDVANDDAAGLAELFGVEIKEA